MFKRPVLLLSAAIVFGASVEAADSPWTRGNRIAISTDGNPDADADDVGATPFTLTVLAKAGLQDILVHYDFNNSLEYKRIEPDHLCLAEFIHSLFPIEEYRIKRSKTIGW
ncbi:hypothetical protein PDESU_06377 [Pontiella desulfatans]|uniref:Uncharacterized protein n=1 Tax=Pontiella desulfatans TaxID=2750659 RepID=A0A6C2UCE4_PONDE|nr:hypothetical protein [Pontiella desulfatans]VGO17775.1 hypothetical protein PDESU_06377 [Pontiella desulfatans]